MGPDAMSPNGPAHWLLALVFLIAAVILPVWFGTRIARKAGYSPWWAVLMPVPVASLVLVWVFAFVRWPAVDGPAPSVPDGPDGNDAPFAGG